MKKDKESLNYEYGNIAIKIDPEPCYLEAVIAGDQKKQLDNIEAMLEKLLEMDKNKKGEI